MNKQKIKICYIAVTLLLIFSMLASFCLGSAKISLSELIEAFGNGMRDVSTPAGRILWYARLPRTIACVFAGSALAVSGAVLQRVLTNKLASPGIIGVNAGAGLAVTLCCALGAVSGWQIAGAAFGGAVCAVLMVALAAGRPQDGHAHPAHHPMTTFDEAALPTGAAVYAALALAALE